MSRYKLYTVVLLLGMAAYTWLGWSYVHNTSVPNICIIKNTTGMPCPSCGTTHSIISISKGDFADAFRHNPFGFIATLMLIILPIWIVIDFIRRSNSFHLFYLQAESRLREKWLAIPAITIILINWIWNFYKQA